MSRVATPRLFAFPSIMAHDGLAPPLALSDILHTLSPSPAPQPSANQPSTPRPPSPPRSPEPLNQTQIDSMRDRVLEIRGQADNTAGLSSRETELISMVSHGLSRPCPCSVPTLLVHLGFASHMCPYTRTITGLGTSEYHLPTHTTTRIYD